MNEVFPLNPQKNITAAPFLLHPENNINTDVYKLLLYVAVLVNKEESHIGGKDCLLSIDYKKLYQDMGHKYSRDARPILKWLDILMQTSIIISNDIGTSKIGCIKNKITRLKNPEYTLQLAIDRELVPFYQAINRFGINVNDIFRFKKLSAIKIYCLCAYHCNENVQYDKAFSLDEFALFINSNIREYRDLNRRHIKPIIKELNSLEEHNSALHISIMPIIENGKTIAISLHAVKKIPVIELEPNDPVNDKLDFRSLPLEIQKAINFIHYDCYGYMSLIKSYLIKDRQNDFINFLKLYAHLLRYKKDNPDLEKKQLGLYTGNKLKNEFTDIDEELKITEQQIKQLNSNEIHEKPTEELERDKQFYENYNLTIEERQKLPSNNDFQRSLEKSNFPFAKRVLESRKIKNDLYEDT